MLLKNFKVNYVKNVSNSYKNKEISKIFHRSISSSKELRNSQQDIIVKSPKKSLEYPKISIDQYVWNNLNKWMNKTAIVDGITDRSITYAQLRDKCRVLAIRLRTSLKLQPNDTIAICLPNSIEFPIIAVGAIEADLTVTTINPNYTSGELSRQLIDSDAKIIFGLASKSDILKDAIQNTKKPIKIVYVKESADDAIPSDGIDFNQLIDIAGVDMNALPASQRDPNSVSFLPYSSGTTGLSKGVMLSQYNLIANSMGINELGYSFDAIGDHQDILACVLPFFHVSGFVGTIMSKLVLGCKLVTLPKFAPDTFLNALVKYKANVLPAVPPIVMFINSFDKIRPEHLQHIEFVISGAAPLGKSDVDKFLVKAPQTQFFQVYGLTEASPFTHAVPKESKKHGSVGIPISDTEVKIVKVDDPTYQGIGPHQTGEILVRGPQVMLGYLNNEKATKETITADGWLRTGDIGYYDEENVFYITDRLKELIKVKAFQVAPAELEELLRMHPEIMEAAVIGIPNEATGEAPRAFVVKAKDSKIDEKTVQDYVAEKVIDYKRLAGGVEFVDSIPKNATGKILRRELKTKYVK